jgi:hypothetical protein
MVTFKMEVSSKNFAGSIEVVWPNIIRGVKKENSNSTYKIDFIVSKLSGLESRPTLISDALIHCCLPYLKPLYFGLIQ